jgi:hypothetical protein
VDVMPAPSEKKMMVLLDWLAPHQGATWDEQRREQWEQLWSNHRENQATGKEGEADLRHHKHSPQKRRNGGIPIGCSG